MAQAHLVLCRLHSENISWALEAAESSSGRVELFLYDSGVSRSPEVRSGTRMTTHTVSNGGHESQCYLEHIHLSAQGNTFAPVTIFSPAMPRCARRGSTKCVERTVRAVLALSRSRASLEPNGFAPIEPLPILPFWDGLPQSLQCLPDAYSQLSQGRDLQYDSEFLSFSPDGSFAVARRNLQSAPRGWLRRAHQALQNATEVPRLHRCCNNGYTCAPWLLERLWPMLLGTPHRGCSSVRTGYCATEWVTTRQDSAHSAIARRPPREGAGAIKLRMDISRVGRVARFTNRLSDDERRTLMEMLAVEHTVPSNAAADQPKCSSQLCAILTLLRAARDGQEEDFALYLSEAVKSTDTLLQTSERAQRRCRQMFVDKSVLTGGIERVELTKDRAMLNHEREQERGQALHRAVQKLYTSCLLQMVEDPRWWQRPFVYGFAKELDQPAPLQA